MLQTISAKCNRCESDLIEVSRVEGKVANFRSAMITTKYLCSNKVCQQDSDNKIAEAEARREAQKQAKLANALQKSQAQP